MPPPAEESGIDGPAGSVGLPVLRLTVPEHCGEDEQACDQCVMHWLERRAEADGTIEHQRRLRLTIPVSGLGEKREIERASRRLRRARLAAGAEQDAVWLEFERDRCPLHEMTEALQGLGLRLRLDEAKLRPAATDAEAAGTGSLRDSLRAVISTVRRERELKLVTIAGVCLVAGAATHWLGGPEALRLLLLAVSAVCSSTATFPEAIRELRSFRLSVDSLMFAAAIGASSLGHYEEGAFLLFLFGLGAAGEHLALSRAKGAIDALAELAPESARVLDEHGEEHERPVEEIEPGSLVAIRPFERIPLDGEIIRGASSVDQSAVTGESMPVDKGPGDSLLAGVINGERSLVMRATRAAGESTLARVMRMVEQAQAERSATELFTERIERVYVPFVMVATLALVLLPPLLTEVAWGVAFYRAMAFLVAASPCALAIGTPAAVLCAIARAARSGVVIKGGAHLETLARARAFAFDKTGTLTLGKPRVTEVVPLGERGADEVLAIAAGIEREVTHPLAEAIRLAADAHGVAPRRAEQVEQVVGIGAVGIIEGRSARIGKRDEAWTISDQASAHADRLRADGATVVWIGLGDGPVGLVAIADTIRPSARDAIDLLRRDGARALAMLTGDHAGSARAIAAQAGIERVHAELMPEQKLDLIESIRAESGTTVMIGDGVNDAPALARADLGIAVAAAGADVAMETADVAIMGGDLTRLPEVVRLARRARRIIAQNLVIALGVIAIVAPLGAVGVAPLGVAVLLHEGSTVVVVVNALRLLRRTGRSALRGE